MIGLDGLVGAMNALRALEKLAIGIAYDERDGWIHFEAALPATVRESLAAPGAMAFLVESAGLAAKSWPTLWRSVSPVERTRLVTLTVVQLVMTPDDWDWFDDGTDIKQNDGECEREYADHP